MKLPKHKILSLSGILPLRYEGVPLMSMGFLRPNEHAAVRGPMASAMVTQMLTTTEWGDLDVLLLDLPPGTGDIHLTVAQQAKLKGFEVT